MEVKRARPFLFKRMMAAFGIIYMRLDDAGTTRPDAQAPRLLIQVRSYRRLADSMRSYVILCHDRMVIAKRTYCLSLWQIVVCRYQMIIPHLLVLYMSLPRLLLAAYCTNSRLASYFLLPTRARRVFPPWSVPCRASSVARREREQQQQEQQRVQLAESADFYGFN